MPLIVMCGLPCSGKSRVAAQLAEYMREKEPSITRVELVNEESCHLRRRDMYKDSTSEKAGRAMLQAPVARNLSNNVLVVSDTCNYIKGIRYEMHCRARELCTTYCVVFCDTPPDTCRAWNEERSQRSQEPSANSDKKQQEDSYDQASFDGLMGQLEVPDGKRRWDHPLFTIRPDDAVPFAAIADHLIRGKAQTQSVATVKKLAPQVNSRFEMDSRTGDIIRQIVAQQKLCMLGDEIVVPHATNRFVVSRKVSLVQLRRLQRQYCKLASQLGSVDIEQVGTAFVQYLNTSV